MKAGKSQRPHGRVDLLKNLSKRNEIAALLYGGWLGPAGKFLDQSAPIKLVVVLQAHERQGRGADVRMIRPGHAVQAGLIDPRPGHSEPDGGDLRLHIAMVPSKSRYLLDAVGSRSSAGAAGGGAGDKVVWVGEHRKARGPERIKGLHVQDLELGGICHLLRDGLRSPGDGIGDGQSAGRPLKGAEGCIVPSRITGEVDIRRIIVVHPGQGGDAFFCLQPAPEVEVQFADLISRSVAIRAWRGDAIAARIGWVGRDHMIALLRSDNKEGVRRGDPVIGKTGEEFVERVVVLLECLDIMRLAWTIVARV